MNENAVPVRMYLVVRSLFLWSYEQMQIDPRDNTGNNQEEQLHLSIAGKAMSVWALLTCVRMDP